MVQESKYKRTNKFRPDPAVRTGSAKPSDYAKSGYDKGHLCPAGDMACDSTAMSESFYMSNMSPQKPGFNRGIWKKLEEQVREWAVEDDVIYVVTGPILSGNLATIGKDKIAVPKYYYKVILDYEEPEFKGIGFVLPNKSSTKPLTQYAVTIDSVEHLTGIDFFAALPDSVERVVESHADINRWEGAKRSINQGVLGYVLFYKGDFMPEIITPGQKSSRSGTVTPVVREIYVYSLTPHNSNFVRQVGYGAFYSKIYTKLIAKTKSDSTGFFQIELPPGKYSFFVKEDSLFYANGIDSAGNILSSTVTKNSMTKLQIDISYLRYD